jgi:hypothetical protein
MKASLMVSFALLAVPGCCLFRPCPAGEDDRVQRLSRIEVRLTDFSMAVTAYYGRRGEQVPADFDEAALFRVLGEAYPRQADVQEVKVGYRVRARATPGGFYDLVLCDKASGGKLMEDLSCTMSAVDARPWSEAGAPPEKTGAPPCDFAADPASLCD